MIQWINIFSRHGKIRLKRWFSTFSQKEKVKMTTEAITTILARKTGMCNVLEWKGKKIVYKRYASLYFAVCTDWSDNELLTLEILHRYVEILDAYFGNVCELDIIFNFEQAYIILDELIIGGEIQESSKKTVASIIKKIDLAEQEDEQMERAK